MSLSWPHRLLIAGTSVLIRTAYRIYGGLHVYGLENVPSNGGAILASNHLSWADPPAMRGIIRRTCWFMANESVLHLPVIGKLLPFYGVFGVEREQIDRDAIRRAEQYLKAGDLLCIYPEGGTTITGRLYPFEGGAALLALRVNVPIVPVAITGTEKLLPDPPKLPPHYVKGGITIRFGKPIHPDDIDASLPRRARIEALTAKVYCAVASMLPQEYLPDGEPDEEAQPAMATVQDRP